MPIHQIADGLYVGPLNETMAMAQSPGSPFKTVINVLMVPAANPVLQAYLQMWQVKVIDHPIESSPMEIPIDRLDSVVRLIDDSKPCAVSCLAAQERSPLVCAYYLSKKKNISLNDAYNEVYSKHPETSIRTHWIKGAIPA